MRRYAAAVAPMWVLTCAVRQTKIVTRCVRAPNVTQTSHFVSVPLFSRCRCLRLMFCSSPSICSAHRLFVCTDIGIARGAWRLVTLRSAWRRVLWNVGHVHVLQQTVQPDGALWTGACMDAGAVRRRALWTRYQRSVHLQYVRRRQPGQQPAPSCSRLLCVCACVVVCCGVSLRTSMWSTEKDEKHLNARRRADY